MQTAPTILDQRRVARVVLWAQTFLSWALLLLYSTTSRINRRHMRQRYGLLSLEGVKQIVCALIIVRAVEIARLRGGSRRQPRDASPLGFRCRARTGGLMRASIGSRLRVALRHRDLRERIARLLAAFADIDGFACRYLVARGRLTRLRPMIIAAPRASACASLAALAPCVTDSS